MAAKQQSGMQGVFLVAAELAKRGYIVSPTSRNAKGADLLVTDEDCIRAWTIQVKTNKNVFSFFLLGKHDKSLRSDSHLYIFVNLKKTGTEYYIVPGKVVSEGMTIDQAKSEKRDIWYSIRCEKISEYKDRWDILGKN